MAIHAEHLPTTRKAWHAWPPPRIESTIAQKNSLKDYITDCKIALLIEGEKLAPLQLVSSFGCQRRE